MKYKITVKGKAVATVENRNREVAVIKDPKILSSLGGLKDDTDFTDYFYDESFSGCVTEGYMRFVLENGELYTYTEYESSRELTERELKELGDYTQGQWSDGIGEGYEQIACKIINGNSIFISPWFDGQKLDIVQETSK